MGRTPDIGATISEGYGTGLDRLPAWGPAIAVVAAATGVATGAIAELQMQLVPDAAEVVAAVFTSGDGTVGASDARTYQLLSTASLVVSFVVSFGVSALFAGILRRERLGQQVDVPVPGTVLGLVVTRFLELMPRVALVVGLFIAGTLVSVVNAILGGIVGLVAVVVGIWLGVRWIYAPVVSGSGEATGDAAFDRSAAVVHGKWWPTFGIFIVIGIATVLPIGLAAGIVSAILPGTFLSMFGQTFLSVFGTATISAAALESAWAQVAGDDADIVDPPIVGEQPAPAPEAPAREALPPAPGDDATHPPTERGPHEL